MKRHLKLRLQGLDEHAISQLATADKENIPAISNYPLENQTIPTARSQTPLASQAQSLLNVCQNRNLAAAAMPGPSSQSGALAAYMGPKTRGMTKRMKLWIKPQGQEKSATEPQGGSTANTSSPGTTAGAGGEWNHSDFKNLIEIGEGGFSTIFKAHSKSKRKIFALKQLTRKATLDPAKLILEHDLQRRAQHPNIAKHFGSYMLDGSHVFVMEYFKMGDLLDVVYETKYLHLLVEPTQKLFIRQIASAVNYIQSNLGYIHKDLKPENILLASKNCVKVTDFGFATPIVSPRHIHSDARARGTLAFLPSEEMESFGFDSTTDVWALGCISYELLTQKRPFMDDDNDGLGVVLPRMKAFENNLSQTLDFAEFQKENPRAYGFVRQLLRSRLERPLISEVESLEWLNN